MEKNEIKKILYRENPKAELMNVSKDRIFYMAKIKAEDKDEMIRFFIPLGDIGDAKFEWLMDSKLLIRWLE
jgi:hypothetical protein